MSAHLTLPTAVEKTTVIRSPEDRGHVINGRAEFNPGSLAPKATLSPLHILPMEKSTLERDGNY